MTLAQRIRQVRSKSPGSGGGLTSGGSDNVAPFARLAAAKSAVSPTPKVLFAASGTGTDRNGSRMQKLKCYSCIQTSCTVLPKWAVTSPFVIRGMTSCLAAVVYDVVRIHYIDGYKVIHLSTRVEVGNDRCDVKDQRRLASAVIISSVSSIPISHR